MLSAVATPLLYRDDGSPLYLVPSFLSSYFDESGALNVANPTYPGEGLWKSWTFISLRSRVIRTRYDDTDHLAISFRWELKLVRALEMSVMLETYIQSLLNFKSGFISRYVLLKRAESSFAFFFTFSWNFDREIKILNIN